MLDAQRALRAFASPGSGDPDVDYVTYWRDYDVNQSADDSASHAQFVRASTAAFPSPEVLRHLWVETAEAALRAAGAADLGALVTTQGHVLTAADFVATLAVEAAIHHVDLLAGSAAAPPQLDAALQLTALTLDGLLGGSRPLPWSNEEYLLYGTGRKRLSADEVTAAGATAGRFPLFT